MERRKSVIAAITSALHAYLELEQQQLHQQLALAESQKVRREAPRPAFSSWVMAGRQASMEMRRYWQMRLVR